MTPHDDVSIAITGLSCRFPGDGDNLENFWQSLCEGKSAWSEMKDSRFHADAFWSQDKRRNKSVARGAHFLKQDFTVFDANFFGISASEVGSMDPQHRIMIEVAYEALETAGYSLEELAGTRTGVFMGHFTSDWKDTMYRDADAAPAYSATGPLASSFANRISWLWDLRGPSFCVDTACSSSLVALHLACQSLRNGESDIAIVGGSNLLINPDMFLFLSGQNFLAPDGKCKAFDASANGYGRGEGFAAIVLKRVGDAVEVADPIRAVIRGTGVNQDGHTKGLTLPSADAQAQLIKDVYNSARLDFGETMYAEAHGTGTQAGDTEETLALSMTLSSPSSRREKLLVGSVKGNIGHTEAAAGIASIIKGVLMLEHGIIPPTINHETPNPKIDFDKRQLKVSTKLSPWPTDGVRRLSINACGYGGTNAHAVLDDAYHYLQSRRQVAPHFTIKSGEKTLPMTNGHGSHSDQPTPYLFPISSQDRQGLKRVRSSLAEFVRNKSPNLADLAYTLSEKRSRLKWKSFVTADTTEELVSVLEANDPTTFECLSSAKPRIGFVFTGQGAQWPGMGMQLMQYDTFRSSVEAADEYMRKELQCPWNAVEELSRSKATSRLGSAIYSQALCTVLQVALVDLLREWGIEPVAVVGHSSGEIGAAYCVKHLDRESAWTLAYERGVVSGSLPTVAPELHGAMMAVGASPERAEEFIERVCPEGGVVVACVNSPSSVTLSGDLDAVNKLEAAFSAEKMFARKLHVDTAYHSHHMQVVVHDYLELTADVQPLTSNKSSITMYSSVTKEVASPDELGAGYWARNLASPVQFASAVQDLVRPTLSGGKRVSENAVDVLIEIGPHSALQGPATQSLKAIGVTNMDYISMLSRGANGIETALNMAGNIFCRGFPVKLAQLNGQSPSSSHPPKMLVNLPAYPWSHTRQYWSESRLAKGYRQRDSGHKRLLGWPTPVITAGERVWRGFVRLAEEPWVSDHKIHGAILYPAAGFLAMAIEAALESADKTRTVSGIRLRDVQFVAAMVIDQDADQAEYTVTLRPHFSGTRETSSTWTEFSVASSPDGNDLVQNSLGLVQIEYDSQQASETVLKDQEAVMQYGAAAKNCRFPRRKDAFYKKLDSLGLNYGETFANVIDLRVRKGQSWGIVKIPDVGLDTSDGRPHIIHPTTLDALFHLVFAATSDSELSKPMVPRSMDSLYLTVDIPYEANTDLKAFSNAAKHGFTKLRSDITVLDEQETHRVLSISGLTCAEVAGSDSQESTSSSKNLCSKLVWRPALDMLTSEQVKQLLAAETAGARDHLVEYIRLSHHIAPELSILEFADEKSILANAALREVVTTSHCAVACADQDAGKEIQKQLADLGAVSPQALGTSEAFKLEKGEGGEKTEPFDIVVASGVSHANAEVDAHVKSLIKPGGKLCLLEDGPDADATEKRLHRLGFTTLLKLENPPDGERSRLLVLQSPAEALTNGHHTKSEEVVLIQAERASPAGQQLAEQLSSSLAMRGYSPSMFSWGTGTVSDLAGKACISLLELEHSLLEDLDERNLDAVRPLLLDSARVFWVVGVDGPSGAMINGLARVIRNEVPGIDLRTLNSTFSPSAKASQLAELVAQAFASPSEDNELLIQDDVIKVSRVVENVETNSQLQRLSPQDSKNVDEMALKEVPAPVKLAIGQMGLLDSLRFEHDAVALTDLREDEVEIQVKATALNFREIMAVMGQIPDALLGFDAAGVVRRIGSAVQNFQVGDRVAMCEHGAHRTVHRARASNCARIPEGLSFEQAASIPTVQATAWYGLVRLAHVRKGQTILIHAAAGGVGQAAIQMAQHFGLEVFVTVGSPAKRKLLTAEYGIADDHIFNSRDLSFADGIRRMTHGRGVDVVLNSLAGEALRETWHCLAPFGYFIEIGLKDILANTRLDMSPFQHNATFSFFNLNLIAREQPTLFAEIMEGTFDFVQRGITRPASLVTYPASDVEGAFRLMQTGKHVGKIAVSFDDEAIVPVARGGYHSVSLALDPEASYVLVGGLGGLGRSLATLLVENGARKLCFLSRSGATSSEAQDLMRELESSDVQATAIRCDVADAKSLKTALKQCVEELGGPVKGVVMCAMVLRDTLFSNMTHAQWVESTRPKVQGTWNLHEALPDVDFFVILSSFAAIFGNRGQANYAAAGAFQDGIAHLRRSQGKHGLTLDIGIMRDIGVLAEKGITDSLRDWEEPYGIRETEFRALMKLAIAGDLEGSLDAQIITGLATGGSALENDIQEPFYLSDAKFAIMAQTGVREHQQHLLAQGQAGSSAGGSVQTLVAKSTSVAEASEHVASALVRRVAKMLQTQSSEIDTGRPLHSYGIDSLVAIEVVNWALKELKASLTVFDVMAGVPITVTATKIATGSGWLPKEVTVD